MAVQVSGLASIEDNYREQNDGRVCGGRVHVARNTGCIQEHHETEC